METRTSGSERGAEETMMRNHHTGASASTLRDCKPSREDRALTQRLVEAGKLLGIAVIDHVIIGDGTSAYFSFADEGLLKRG
jgi:DNA repair protein RadC